MEKLRKMEMDIHLNFGLIIKKYFNNSKLKIKNRMKLLIRLIRFLYN